MFNILFQPRVSFNTSPNSLIKMSEEYSFCENSVTYGSFSKTNIFIGENNSGKSRFLRFLYTSNYYEISPEQYDAFLSLVNERHTRIKIEKEKSKLDIFNNLYTKITEATKSSYTYESRFFDIIKTCSKPSNKIDRYYFPVLRGFKDYKSVINNKLNNFSTAIRSIQNKDSINHYISLLNLDTKGLDDFDIYREIITREYFAGQGESINHILTGGKLYQEIKSMLLGKVEKRQLIDEFQTFLRDNFFSEYEKVQLIPNETEKILYVKIGEDERPIYDWGDGTQQLIIILYSLFIHKDEENKVFFIEEPEMYLHPGILRRFIEVINSDVFKNHQYFITTHSNTILDTSADANIDMSIFKFKKIKENLRKDKECFSVEQCNYGDVSLLNELGVRNSSVFLSNCSIWVEGITDRLYLKHFLNLYMEKNGKTRFRENIDFTFIEYGGNNLVHFNFESADASESINAKYINNKIFLIADNDGSLPGSAKQKRKDRLKEILADNFYELKGMEIENLITKEVLKNVLIKQNTDKKTIIVDKLSNDIDFSNKKMGSFIDTLFEGELKSYSSESGSVKNKLSFCNNVVEEIRSYDDLCDEAKNLVEKIYAFIEQNN